MAISWYGVKTIYGSRCSGKTSGPKGGTPSTVVEERVVIFRARTFAEAIKKAEKEASEYCNWKYTNPFGQKVKTKYLGACDAFILLDPPKSGSEVYSGMNAVDPRISDSQVIEGSFGNERAFKRTHRFFLNRSSQGTHGKGRNC